MHGQWPDAACYGRHLSEAFAVDSIGYPASDGARPLPEVTVQMDSLQRAHEAGDYVNLGHALPGIVGELYLHASEPAADDGQAAAARALVDVCGWAAWMCRSMRYGDPPHPPHPQRQERHGSAALGVGPSERPLAVAVSTCHATGSPVAVQTAAWTLYP